MQKNSKTFHYSWLFLSIVLVAWDFPKDSQFPPMEKDLLEAEKFTSLWDTKDVVQVMERKVFWVLMEASIRISINQKPQLSPTMFDQLSRYVEFKVEFHHIYIRGCKDPNQK